jgi:phosphogluconate dehydratase
VLVPEAEWQARKPVSADLSMNAFGVGRDLFTPFRMQVNRADEGATIFRTA